MRISLNNDSSYSDTESAQEEDISPHRHIAIVMVSFSYFIFVRYLQEDEDDWLKLFNAILT